MSVLDNLEPRSVFKYFEEICSIPHGSSDTWKISNYLVQFAKDRQLSYIQDELGNVVIFKNGTAGYENSPAVIIQGHMDMVCEKEKNCEIDFFSEGLKLRVDGNVISAIGTTLGGDDGIAVAYALAILDAKDGELSHPPLEVVITVDEEIGMLGAAGFDYSRLSARLMLNIDSEEEGELLVSCAGGATSSCHLPVEYENVSGREFILEVSGITGGHSGVEIINQGANADKVLGRLLYELAGRVGIRLISVLGGQKDNAIPRQAKAIFVIDDEQEYDKAYNALKEFVHQYNDILQSEYRITDPDICVSIQEAKNSNMVRCMTKKSTNTVITMLVCLPNGISKMSSNIEGLVQTSLNLGILKTVHNAEVVASFSVRSSVGTEKDALMSQLRCLVNELGGYYTESGKYPAWEYKTDSVLRDIMVSTYEEMYGYAPKVSAIHAGVECGLFAEGLPGLDCVSYGPRIEDIHTTSERLYIDSVKRTWDYTLEILKRLK